MFLEKFSVFFQNIFISGMNFSISELNSINDNEKKKKRAIFNFLYKIFSRNPSYGVVNE